MKIKFNKTLLFAAAAIFAGSAKVNAQSTTTGNTFVSGRFIGWGTTSGDLGFRVNNNVKMTLQNTTGNFGINTTNPTSVLHTVASGAKTATYTGNLFTNIATSNTASVIKYGVNIQSTGTWNGTSAINTGLNVTVSGGTTNYAALFNGGNVGIGTTSPNEKLHIDAGILKLSSGNAAGGPMITFADVANAAYRADWGIEYSSASSGNTKTGLNFWKPFGSPNSGNFYLFLADNGRVGVNTDNPTAQFTVNGNVLIGDPATVCIPNANYKLFVETGILTEKVKIAIKCSASWADYVFAEDYKLKSLNEVEAFVKENKHLSNIPSADEVVKNGVDMGEITSKLLGKVEELTLYLIDQNKKIDLLQNELNTLKKN